MQKETISRPLLVALIKSIPLPWYLTTSITTFILLIFFVLAAYLSGSISKLVEWDFLRDNLNGPVLIVYILATYPFIWRLRNQALKTFKPLIGLDEYALKQVWTEVTTPNRLHEWIAIIIGVTFALFVGQPWNLEWSSNELWLYVYLVFIVILLWGLLGWLIYDILVGIVRLARLSRRNLKIDIFNTGVLTPIARWSLATSALFVGGISLSLIFQTQENLITWQNITIYSVLIITALLIFFMSIQSVHRAIVKAKSSKTALANKHLTVASHELEEKAASGQLEGIGELSSAVAAWAAYEKKVSEVHTWPFNTVIIRRLFASILAPAVIYLLKVLSVLGIRISF